VDDGGYPVQIIDGVPVITPPGEIDVTTAGELLLALLEAAARGSTTIVVDLTGTPFCDSAGLTVLVQAHRRALAEGGELRLVIPADGAVFRVFTLTGLDRFIPRFDRVGEALRPRPTAANLLPQPRRSPN
jgi:anti-sigma B factor antagonist